MDEESVMTQQRRRDAACLAAALHVAVTGVHSAEPPVVHVDSNAMAVQQLDEVQLGAAAGLTAAQTAAAMQDCHSPPVKVFRLWSVQQPGMWLPRQLLLAIVQQVSGAQRSEGSWDGWLRAGKSCDQLATRTALQSERKLLNACGQTNRTARGHCSLIELESVVACLRACHHVFDAAAAAQLSKLADALAGLPPHPGLAAHADFRAAAPEVAAAITNAMPGGDKSAATSPQPLLPAQPSIGPAGSVHRTRLREPTSGTPYAVEKWLVECQCGALQLTAVFKVPLTQTAISVPLGHLLSAAWDPAWNMKKLCRYVPPAERAAARFTNQQQEACQQAGVPLLSTTGVQCNSIAVLQLISCLDSYAQQTKGGIRLVARAQCRLLAGALRELTQQTLATLPTSALPAAASDAGAAGTAAASGGMAQPAAAAAVPTAEAGKAVLVNADAELALQLVKLSHPFEQQGPWLRLLASDGAWYSVHQLSIALAGWQELGATARSVVAWRSHFTNGIAHGQRRSSSVAETAALKRAGLRHRQGAVALVSHARAMAVLAAGKGAEAALAQHLATAGWMSYSHLQQSHAAWSAAAAERLEDIRADAGQPPTDCDGAPPAAGRAAGGKRRAAGAGAAQHDEGSQGAAKRQRQGAAEREPRLLQKRAPMAVSEPDAAAALSATKAALQANAATASAAAAELQLPVAVAETHNVLAAEHHRTAVDRSGHTVKAVAAAAGIAPTGSAGAPQLQFSAAAADEAITQADRLASTRDAAAAEHILLRLQKRSVPEGFSRAGAAKLARLADGHADAGVRAAARAAQQAGAP